jgi:hypothetical protein
MGGEGLGGGGSDRIRTDDGDGGVEGNPSP